MSDAAKPRDEHNGSKPGADVSFPYDRMTVEQFRVDRVLQIALLGTMRELMIALTAGI